MTTTPDDQHAYYFGYGTLLGTEEMHRYCPMAEKVTVASYPDHRLEFWAYTDEPGRVGCHLAQSAGSVAYGVVYRVPISEMADLDEASGVGKGWFRRVPIDVTSVAGSPMVVTTYFLNDPTRPETPPEAYSGLVRTGSQSAGLPEEFVRRLETYLDGLPPRPEY